MQKKLYCINTDAENNVRMVSIVDIIFMACILFHCHSEQNAFMQGRQKVVKVDMLKTKVNFLNQFFGNMFVIFLFHSIKWILHTIMITITDAVITPKSNH